jgi:anthranilate synthase/indole-3-glycerol phosphate synthase/phosphoribosylanthranilate isomerase
MLPEDLLKELYAFSVSLGMEPLVEVNNSREMEVALALNAKVIGVNNRNLHSFDVDMGTTSRLREMVTGRDVILCALSGISAKEDIDKYAQEGIKAVLIGESLMRAKDTASFIRQLFSIPEPASHEPVWRSSPPLVKICGIRTAEEAVAVALAGADFLGLVFAEKSRRRVDLDVAKSISRAIREARFDEQQAAAALDPGNTPWFTTHATRLSSGGNGPLLVGVFQNASLAEVLHTVSYVQLDLVQLHGTEPIEWAAQIPVPVIRAFHVGSDGSGLKNITRPGAHQFVLLDSMREDGSGVSGGSGKILDLSLAKRAVDAGEFVVQGEAAYMSPERDGEEEEEKSSENSASPPAEAAANGEEPAPRDHAANGVPAIETTPSPFSRYPLPIILAGGLTPDNIAGAVEQVRPWAVDVSGGVEAEDGLSKDLTKVEAFVQAVKSIGT